MTGQGHSFIVASKAGFFTSYEKVLTILNYMLDGESKGQTEISRGRRKNFDEYFFLNI